MNKNIVFFLTVLVVLVGAVGCRAPKEAQASKESETPATPIRLTRELLQRTASEGLEKLRFHFEKDLSIFLAEIPGNGEYEVDKNGNLVIVSEKVVKFPVQKLGKFVGSVSNQLTEFDATWEKDVAEESYSDSDNSERAIIRLIYDEAGNLIIKADGTMQYKGQERAFVSYKGVRYLLPPDYKTFFLKSGTSGSGETKEVSGVSKPGQ